MYGAGAYTYNEPGRTVHEHKYEVLIQAVTSPPCGEGRVRASGRTIQKENHAHHPQHIFSRWPHPPPHHLRPHHLYGRRSPLAPHHAQLANAGRKRKADHLAGRIAAAHALPDHTVPAIGPSGEPLWPQGISGSITHSGTQAIAVVTQYPALIGIDCETILSENEAGNQRRHH